MSIKLIVTFTYKKKSADFILESPGFYPASLKKNPPHPLPDLSVYHVDKVPGCTENDNATYYFQHKALFNLFTTFL